MEDDWDTDGFTLTPCPPRPLSGYTPSAAYLCFASKYVTFQSVEGAEGETGDDEAKGERPSIRGKRPSGDAEILSYHLTYFKAVATRKKTWQ